MYLHDLTVAVLLLVMAQAADNFGFELAALRRSFRYNEYQEMEAPPNFFARVRLPFGCSMAEDIVDPLLNKPVYPASITALQQHTVFRRGTASHHQLVQAPATAESVCAEAAEAYSPLPICLQLAASAGGSVVRGLAGLDSWLEGNKLLPELKPLEVPEAVQDEDGQMNAECKEVSICAHHLCRLWRV